MTKKSIFVLAVVLVVWVQQPAIQGQTLWSSDRLTLKTADSSSRVSVTWLSPLGRANDQTSPQAATAVADVKLAALKAKLGELDGLSVSAAISFDYTTFTVLGPSSRLADILKGGQVLETKLSATGVPPVVVQVLAPQGVTDLFGYRSDHRYAETLKVGISLASLEELKRALTQPVARQISVVSVVGKFDRGVVTRAVKSLRPGPLPSKAIRFQKFAIETKGTSSREYLETFGWALDTSSMKSVGCSAALSREISVRVASEVPASALQKVVWRRTGGMYGSTIWLEFAPGVDSDTRRKVLRVFADPVRAGSKPGPQQQVPLQRQSELRAVSLFTLGDADFSAETVSVDECNLNGLKEQDALHLRGLS
jgi:hypothetical protein